MHISTQRRIKTTRLQMTPMIDVVFLLITFFMVVTEITRQDQVEGLELPGAETAAEIQSVDPLIISVLQDGTYYVGGQPRTLAELRDILLTQARLERNVPVLIRADKRARYRTVRDVIKTCAERHIRIWRVSFATLPQEDKP